jgi:CDGSH-type Zn-finger protein
MEPQKEKAKTQKSAAKIKVTKNGPYLVSGKIPLQKQIIIADSEGTATEWQPSTKYSPQEKARALVVLDKQTGKVIEPKFAKSIGLIEDPAMGVSGPIWVRGGVPVESDDGKTYQVRNRVTLCRFGKSKNKPFCDSSHYPEAESMEKVHKE